MRIALYISNMFKSSISSQEICEKTEYYNCIII